MTLVLERTATTEREARSMVPRCLDISIADLDDCLAGTNYPAGKHDLIERGKLNGATDDVMVFLRLLPQGKYHQFHDIAFMAWSYLVV